MTDRDKLAYYKALIQRNTPLTGSQQADYNSLVARLGGASVEAMPTGTIKFELARQVLG